ncbi:MAG: SURF1 family protein [Candidatus Nanopelagicales bacterium]|nr:SURF1 family protein [Candidatus Nanopelagicales bacterium]
MLALLKTRRWLSFTALVVLAITGFGLLSRWQWDRADERRVERIAISQAQVLDRVDSVTDLGEFSRVQVSGTFVNEKTQLVRQRPLDGGNGYWVMTPLSVQTGLQIWVLRGWLGASTIATEVPFIPPASSGEITVTGAIRNFEAPLDDVYGLPKGVVAKMSKEELNATVSNATVDNRIVQSISVSPGQEELVIVPLPDIDESQNISYAVQWILFALVAIVGWFVFLRREAHTTIE